VLFTSGEASLPPDARRQLDQLAQLLKTPQARDLRVMVVGHTDSRTVGKRGTRDHYPDNWHLSAARALNVAEYLQRAGLREDQVGIAGYGRHQPLAANETDAARMRNRRVEIFITGPETPIVGWTETATNLYR
jgi:chemotaxis protein MotB